MTFHPRGLEPSATQIRLADTSPMPATFDPDARTVDCVISVGSAVQRPYGTEVLRVTPGAVDLTRLTAGGIPVLDSHNQRGIIDNHLGRYTRIWFGSDKGKPALLGTIKFNATERGEIAMGMVARGEIAGISAGYTVRQWEISDSDGKLIDPEKTRINFDDDLIFTASRWELCEGSLVTVPADSAATVRSMPGVSTTTSDVIARMRARQRMSGLGIHGHPDDVRARMLARQRMHDRMRNLR